MGRPVGSRWGALPRPLVPGSLSPPGLAALRGRRLSQLGPPPRSCPGLSRLCPLLPLPPGSPGRFAAPVRPGFPWLPGFPAPAPRRPGLAPRRFGRRAPAGFLRSLCGFSSPGGLLRFPWSWARCPPVSGARRGPASLSPPRRAGRLCWLTQRSAQLALGPLARQLARK